MLENNIYIKIKLDSTTKILNDEPLSNKKGQTGDINKGNEILGVPK